MKGRAECWEKGGNSGMELTMLGTCMNISQQIPLLCLTIMHQVKRKERKAIEITQKIKECLGRVVQDNWWVQQHKE